MCSSSLFEMENYQGDLTDIVRASGKTGTISEDPFSSDHWLFPSEMAMNFSSSMEEPREEYSFGDPFSASIRDPLLHELGHIISGSSSSSSSSSSSFSASTFFNATSTGGLEDTGRGRRGGGSFGGPSTTIVSPTIGSLSHEDELVKRPCNIFSRMLQISPARNKFPISPCDSPLLGNSPRAIINTNSELHHFVDNTGVQISSPRNPAGIKRRKSQARKVVCVPAPVAANGRPNGEVIPSDLWAWRKYGQKPIKGSPYPRGYYRCSSSKGCSARKQVERSRTDPNMLVITYTSEHNHPWPTQRNALAGSSRSQQSKNNAAATANCSKLSNTTTSQPQPQKINNAASIEITAASTTSTTTTHVKEEFIEDIERQFDLDDGDLGEGFPYRVTMPENNNQTDDFFADLEELEADPLHLLFTKGDYGQKLESKALDVPFSGLFDWAATATATTASTSTEAEENNNANSTSSFKEAKRGFY